MNNIVLPWVNRLFPGKRTLIKTINSQRRAFSFAIYLLLGLLASTLVACYATNGAASETSYRTAWIGNTFGGGSKWVQIRIDAMSVSPDGTVYTNSDWDEAGRQAGIYKDGDIAGMAIDLHGWGKGGGLAVTANSKYLFVGMIQGNEGGGLTGRDYPPKGTDWYCLRRYHLNGKPAPFSGKFGDGSMLIVSESSQITGLASTDNELYASDPATNRIRVYDPETMSQLRDWSFDRPRQIAVDKSGNLWIIQAAYGSNPPKILHYSKTGKQLPEQIVNVVDPTALAVDNQGRLLVAENGPRQQVLIYDIAKKPSLVGTLGTEGGIYSGTPGEVGALKFAGLSGVGTDAKGNIYVSSNGFHKSGVDLRKFSPSGELQWQLLGLHFLDTADADAATDAVDVFSKDEHFVMDYSKGSGSEWSYKGYTINRFRYPDDPRLNAAPPTSPFVRHIGGKRFLYLTDQGAERLCIYRFDGEIAIPSAIFAKHHSNWPANQPKNESWLWRDRNGDGFIQDNEYESLGKEDSSIWGWEVDSNGDIWQASESGFIRHYRTSGLDAHGSPIYTDAASETIPMPAPFSVLTRLKYFPDTDVMYLGGYTSDRPNIDGDWGLVGTEIIRYDNWSKPEKKVRWRIALPYNPSADPKINIKAMDIAGDKVFAVTVRTAEVYVYDVATGDSVTKLTPGTEVGSENGWVDTAYGLRAYQRADGEYLVFVEEVLKGKVIMYRLALT
jgi:hypothetical protein